MPQFPSLVLSSWLSTFFARSTDTIVQAVVATVDNFGDLLELLLISKLIQPFGTPEQTGDAKAHFFGASHLRLIDQIESQQASGYDNWRDLLIESGLALYRFPSPGCVLPRSLRPS